MPNIINILTKIDNIGHRFGHQSDLYEIAARNSHFYQNGAAVHIYSMRS